MIEYRLIEREYPFGIRYVVEKSTYAGDWTSVYSSPDIDAARQVLQERKSRNIVIKEKIIE